MTEFDPQLTFDILRRKQLRITEEANEMWRERSRLIDGGAIVPGGPLDCMYLMDWNEKLDEADAMWDILFWLKREMEGKNDTV